LALQLKLAQTSIEILVLEKRKFEAPIATHKVCESTSELGASYLREVLQLSEYLTEKQLPKFGFRFFFSPEHNGDMAKRVEAGSRISIPYPTHQIDRGILENDLTVKALEAGISICKGSKVNEMDLDERGHAVRYERNGSEVIAMGRWLVDATGRNSLLKRKLNLSKAADHHINSVWFRVGQAIDIDYWSDNLTWRHRLDAGRRRLATNHLMGNGYWVWIIPLVSGCTSIGIVADPMLHPFDTFNTLEKAMQWLAQHEPVAFRMIAPLKEAILDFKVMKDFAYNCKQFYSPQRWAITGEAGAFLDPFYSPGTDFIALGNSWITDLILRDMKEEEISMRAMIYDLTHRELLNGWIHLYRGMYSTFGKTQVMLMKIVWDWASYWAIPNVMFMNHGYTNIAVLKQFSSPTEGVGRRFSLLNECMQRLFRLWGEQDNHCYQDRFLNVFELRCLHRFQSELTLRSTENELMSRIRCNLNILEQIAAEIFRMASSQVNGTPDTMPVNPYEMRLDQSASSLLEKSRQPGVINVVEDIKADINKFWLHSYQTSYHELA